MDAGLRPRFVASLRYLEEFVKPRVDDRLWDMTITTCCRGDAVMLDRNSGDDTIEVTVTFDDGPHPRYTTDLLDLLARENVPAVFFVCGKHVAASCGRDIIKRAATEGHLIGNHSYTHQSLSELSRDQIQSEILRTHELIAPFEPPDKLFRPPYGRHSATLDIVLKEFAYRLVMWDVDSEDWKPERQPAGWIDISLNQIKRRRHTIFLCHDKYATTIDNMPAFFKRLREVGKVEFVARF